MQRVNLTLWCWREAATYPDGVADALEWRWGGDVADETVEEAHDVW